MPRPEPWAVLGAAIVLWPGPAAGQRAGLPAWTPPVMSALVPGSGQLVSGSIRGVVYLALEAGLLTGHFVSVADGRDAREQYRSLAFTVARAPFQPMVRDTVFQYFEAMSGFLRSGPFDTDPGPDLAPPTDPNTFNGRIWQLARQTFFPDPSAPPPVDSPLYRRALDFYRRRAVGPAFEWSWVGAEEAFDRFREELERSDEAFRRGTILIGFVLANHLVSAIDGVISARLEGREIGLGSEVRAAPGARAGARWQVFVRVGF